MHQPLLLLGTGDSAVHEFTLAQIATLHPVVLADAVLPAWARPYLVRHLAVDPADGVTTIDGVEAYAAKHELKGVLTYVGEHLRTAAQVANRLELRGPAAESVAVCCDRVAARAALAKHNVPVPRWAEAYSPEDMYGRMNGEPPSVCDRPRQGVLLEQLHTGPQVAAEVVVTDRGDPQIVAITRTILGPPPARQPVRHSIYAHDSLMHNHLMRRTVERVASALGVTFGLLHLEMKLTALGPRVTDVACHVPGNLIPLLIKRATGISLPQVAADLIFGRPPHLTPTKQRAAAVHFAYPATSGRIERLALTTPQYRPLVDHAAVTQQIGHEVAAVSDAASTDRLAH
ncbi:acetyl-CoA carboxylase biotin carboxylase subunit family protein [Streptomyces sp. NPDC058145]|uniref:ATP-grasp domain-containing protein n=1 Tax=Streptomyces sp. NPDC058145 TaxID=3346356 RepID=UPI0036ED17DC